VAGDPPCRGRRWDAEVTDGDHASRRRAPGSVTAHERHANDAADARGFG
jgi:hypothetical protein